MSPWLAFIAGICLGGGLLAALFIAGYLASVRAERQLRRQTVRTAPIAWSQVQAQREAAREGRQ